MLLVEQGSLYPALHRLEDRGWIASYWGASETNRRARFYKLTPKGKKHLAVGVEPLGRAGAGGGAGHEAGGRPVRRMSFFLASRAARERERADEMQAHQDLFVEELVARGRTPDEARREARLKFGNPRAKLEEVGRPAAAAGARRAVARSALRGARAARARRRSRSPRSSPSRSSSAPTAPSSASPTRSCCGGCRTRSPIGSSTSHTTRDNQWTSIGQDGNGWEAIRDRVPSLTAAVYAGTGGGVNLLAANGALVRAVPARQRQLLPRPRRAPAPRPRLHGGGRRAERPAGRDSQSRALAAALQRRRQRDSASGSSCAASRTRSSA